MTDRPQQTVVHELVWWARVVLIGTQEPTMYERVKAYRILAPIDPRSYQARLARVLTQWSYDWSLDEKPGARLVLLREAVAAARAIPEGEPGRADDLVDVLATYQIRAGELKILRSCGRRQLRQRSWHAAGDCGRMRTSWRWTADSMRWPSCCEGC